MVFDVAGAPDVLTRACLTPSLRQCGQPVQLTLRFRIIRLEPQRILKMGRCFRAHALSRQNGPEVEMRFGVVEFDF